MTVCAIGDLGPGCLDLKGIRANDRNLMYINLSVTGTPVVLTGTEVFEAQARLKAKDTGAPAISAEVSIANAATGRLAIRWPGTDVATMLGTADKWKGVWDLQQTDAVPEPVTLLAGKFEAGWDVTRP